MFNSLLDHQVCYNESHTYGETWFTDKGKHPTHAFEHFGPLLPFLIVICFMYRENAGLLALTRVGSRRVIQISAGFMIFFSVFGMLAQVTLSYQCL